MQQTAYARIVYERYNRKRVGGVGIRRSKTLLEIFKDFIRGLIAFLFTQVGVCGLLVAYNVVGAFIFRSIEGYHGDSSIEEEAALAQDMVIDQLWNLTLSLNVLEEPLWRRNAEKVVVVYQDTLVPLIKRKNYKGLLPVDTWTIPASLMYALSVYTTIGYGNLVPRTDAGKVATIFYALLGMPLMLLYMSNVGEVLGKCFKFIYFRLCSCGITTYPRKPTSQRSSKKQNEKSIGNIPSKIQSGPRKSENAKDTSRETIPILWCILVIAIYVISGGMAFAYWEGWSQLDGCYFCYISLSTVGFGDLVPGRVLKNKSMAGVETIQVLATVYLLIGMALVAMCFNLMQEEALENLKTFWRSLGCLRRERKKNKSLSIKKKVMNKLGYDKEEKKLRRTYQEEEGKIIDDRIVRINITKSSGNLNKRT